MIPDGWKKPSWASLPGRGGSPQGCVNGPPRSRPGVVVVRRMTRGSVGGLVVVGGRIPGKGQPVTRNALVCDREGSAAVGSSAAKVK